MTAIDAALRTAYLQTAYRVNANPPFVLRIGHSSAALKALHQRLDVTCSAFITAANPCSRACDAETNAARQSALASEINALGLHWLAGTGEPLSGGWPAEPSFLVLGMQRTVAEDLGRRWQQNAMVFSAADACPLLVWLR